MRLLSLVSDYILKNYETTYIVSCGLQVKLFWGNLQ